MTSLTFKPKLFSTLRHYDRRQFTTDLLAGIIVGIVALPLAIAFGIASGVTPEKGIITAIVAGLIISLFGGSKVQIGGPTGAFIIIIYGIIQQYGFEGLTIATLMAGVFLIMFGVLHLGTIIKYIPYPIVVGFTSGIALTIFTTQIKDLFGLTMASVPSDFIEKWIAYIGSFSTIDYWSAGVGIGSVIVHWMNRHKRRLVHNKHSAVFVYYIQQDIRRFHTQGIFGEHKLYPVARGQYINTPYRSAVGCNTVIRALQPRKQSCGNIAVSSQKIPDCNAAVFLRHNKNRHKTASHVKCTTAISYRYEF